MLQHRLIQNMSLTGSETGLKHYLPDLAILGVTEENQDSGTKFFNRK
jgi:hypothetical protein